MAGELFICENPVKIHVRNIRHKLQLRRRTAAVLDAVRSGLGGGRERFS